MYVKCTHIGITKVHDIVCMHRLGNIQMETKYMHGFSLTTLPVMLSQCKLFVRISLCNKMPDVYVRVLCLFVFPSFCLFCFALMLFFNYLKVTLCKENVKLVFFLFLVFVGIFEIYDPKYNSTILGAVSTTLAI